MKKLFTMLVASVCCTMAFAATSSTTISVSNVTILKGGTTRQMEVTINATGNTAFQFDLTLPKGVSVKKATLGSIESNKTAAANQTRQLRHKLFDSNANKYRFLSYDNGNAALTDTKVIITLEAAATATVGNNIDVAGSDVLAVKINNGTITPSTQGNGNVAKISVVDGAEISIGSYGKTTFVGSKDLDFTDSEVTAYIASGYDKTNEKIWLTRVKDVPAGTPIMLTGTPSGDNPPYIVPATTSQTYYPENYLKGSATADVAVSDNYDNMALSQGQFTKWSSTTFPKGKAYLQLPKTIASSTGGSFQFTMGQYGKKSHVDKNDLDFTSVDGLSAYTVTGYSKDGTFWLTKVNKVSKGTPVYLFGTAGQQYEVPSVAVESSYINMLKGDADNNIDLPVTDNGFTNCISMQGMFTPLGSAYSNFPAGSCYMQIPSSYLPASARGEYMDKSMLVTEVICMSLNDINGDSDATGISRIAAETAVGNDAWYNLSGQRISAPTKRGLYIRNGKKVIVK